MKNRFSIQYLILILCLVSSGLLQAEDNQYVLAEESYNVLTSVREAMEQQDYQTAGRKLDELLASDLKPYDMAVAYQTLGYIQMSTGKNAGAVRSFDKALEGDRLPAEVQHQIHYLLAQLYIQESDYQNGIRYLETWLDKEPSPDKSALVLAAISYYQLENYKEMIKMARRALDISGKPDPSLYELLISGYFKIQDYKNAAALLEKMVVLFPDNNNYWLQLAMSHQLGNNPEKAMAIFEIALAMDILDENQLLQLAHLYLAENLPYKAARLLERNIEEGKIEKTAGTLELLANSWLLAKEHKNAIRVLNRLATLSNDPEIYFRLGQINFDQGNWQETITALESAISKKPEHNIAETQLLLGIAAYHTGNTVVSTRALNEAANYNETRKQALWWLNKLNEEMENSEKG